MNNNKLIYGLILAMLFYAFWGFIWTETIFVIPLMNNIVVMLLFPLFIFATYNSKINRINSKVIVWIPFMFYTLMGYLVQGQSVYFGYWACCLGVLLLSGNPYLYKYISYKFVLYTGIICLLGSVFQFLLTDIYNSYIANFYLNSAKIKLWANIGYGFTGFTYQLDTTAVPILLAEGLYMYNPYKSEKKGCFIIVACFIISIILTGKRMAVLLSIIIPIIIEVVTSKKILFSIKKFVFSCVCILIILNILYINLDYLYESQLFHRFAGSYIAYTQGTDISGGRVDLYDLAWDIYLKNPLFGIGVGNFMIATNALTDVHNTYLQILCEQGLFGFFTFIIPLLFCLAKTIIDAKKYNCNLIKFTLFVELFYCLYAFTGNVNINLYGYFVYFIFISAYISYGENIRRF
jgi:O-antigen ligase